MPHGHALVNQSLVVDSVALSTLNARSALDLNTQFANPTQSFLAKRLRYFLQVSARVVGDDGPLLVGCAHGDASVSEIEAAMIERNVNGQDDITSMLDQDTAWTVYQDTITPIVIAGDGTTGEAKSHWIKFPGRNGTPLLEGSGMKIFVYNAGSGNLSTGSIVNGIVMVQGVWLRD